MQTPRKRGWEEERKDGRRPQPLGPAAGGAPLGRPDEPSAALGVDSVISTEAYDPCTLRVL